MIRIDQDLFKPDSADQASDQTLNAELRKALTQAVAQVGHQDKLELTSPTLEKDLAKLVLTIVELVRRLLESQALHRMERGSLNDDEIDRVGDTLMRAEDQIHQIAAAFGLQPSDLNLELGPLGRLFLIAEPTLIAG